MRELSPEAAEAAAKEIGDINFILAHLAVPMALLSGMLAGKSLYEGDHKTAVVEGVIFVASMGVHRFATKDISCDYYDPNWKEICKKPKNSEADLS